MEEPKISVIVPVYKVEPYLRRCLDSIVHQTYENLEIILVDDGSPDRCGEICDEYAAHDVRVQVVHKPNGGVSSARNAGLAMAAGEWIGWVDADDWIEPDMYTYMLKCAVDCGADIAVCGRVEQYRDRSVFRRWEEEQSLDTEQALEQLLKNDIMQNFLWDKLCRRELFDGLSFPAGKTFEDVAVMHRLFVRAKRVVCLPETQYHYFQHPGSIIADASLQNKVHYYIAARCRYEEMRHDWPQFSDLLAAQCVVSAVSLWGAYYSNPKQVRRQFQAQLDEIAVFCGQHYKKALQSMKLGITGRAVLHMTPYAEWWSFMSAYLFSRLYKWKHGRNL